MLAHKLIRELETGEDLREDLSLHHHLCHVHAVLGNLCQGTAHLSLQLGVLVQDQGGQVGNSTCMLSHVFTAMQARKLRLSQRFVAEEATCTLCLAM